MVVVKLSQVMTLILVFYFSFYEKMKQPPQKIIQAFFQHAKLLFILELLSAIFLKTDDLVFAHFKVTTVRA